MQGTRLTGGREVYFQFYSSYIPSAYPKSKALPIPSSFPKKNQTPKIDPQLLYGPSQRILFFLTLRFPSDYYHPKDEYSQKSTYESSPYFPFFAPLITYKIISIHKKTRFPSSVPNANQLYPDFFQTILFSKDQAEISNFIKTNLDEKFWSHRFYSYTPIEHAIICKNMLLLKSLCKFPSYCCPRTRYSIFFLAICCDIEIESFEVLLDAYQNKFSSHFPPPLHFSVQLEDKRFAKLLIEQNICGIHVDSWDYLCWSPLHFSVINRNYSGNVFLIDHGADVNIKSPPRHRRKWEGERSPCRIVIRQLYRRLAIELPYLLPFLKTSDLEDSSARSCWFTLQKEESKSAMFKEICLKRFWILCFMDIPKDLVRVIISVSFDAFRLRWERMRLANIVRPNNYPGQRWAIQNWDDIDPVIKDFDPVEYLKSLIEKKK